MPGKTIVEFITGKTSIRLIMYNSKNIKTYYDILINHDNSKKGMFFRIGGIYYNFMEAKRFFLKTINNI